MKKPMIKIHNAETDEVIEREMTDLEFQQYEADQLQWQTEQAAREAAEAEKAEAKVSAETKLVALGLTEAEIAALRG